MDEIRRALPSNRMVVSETLSNEQSVERGIQADDPLRAIAHPGPSLVDVIIDAPLDTSA
jgi:hypothetical protein